MCSLPLLGAGGDGGGEGIVEAAGTKTKRGAGRGRVEEGLGGLDPGEKRGHMTYLVSVKAGRGSDSIAGSLRGADGL